MACVWGLAWRTQRRCVRADATKRGGTPRAVSPWRSGVGQRCFWGWARPLACLQGIVRAGTKGVLAHLSPYISLKPASMACAEALWPPPVLLMRTSTRFCALALRFGRDLNGHTAAAAGCMQPEPSCRRRSVSVKFCLVAVAI